MLLALIDVDTRSWGLARVSDTPPRPFAAPKDLHHRPLTTGARVCGVCRVGPAVEGAARARPGASGAYSGCAAAGATPRSIFFDHQARRTNGRQPRRGRICVQTPFAARARPTQRWTITPDAHVNTSLLEFSGSSRPKPDLPSARGAHSRCVEYSGMQPGMGHVRWMNAWLHPPVGRPHHRWRAGGCFLRRARPSS